MFLNNAIMKHATSLILVHCNILNLIITYVTNHFQVNEVAFFFLQTSIYTVLFYHAFISYINTGVQMAEESIM